MSFFPSFAFAEQKIDNTKKTTSQKIAPKKENVSKNLKKIENKKKPQNTLSLKKATITPQKEKKKIKTDKHKEAYKYWNMAKKYNSGSVGIGLGIPYGYFGTNIELVPIQYKYGELINIVANFGFTKNQLFAFGGGLRFYALGSKSAVRPRITLMFGTNAIINQHILVLLNKQNIRYNLDETHYGLTLGTGIRFLFGKEKRHGFDIDLNFVLYSTINKRIDELSKPDKNNIAVMNKDDKPFFLSFSAGYRFAF